MKRSSIMLVLVICLVLALSLVLGACGGGGDVVGTWNGGDGVEFEFTADGAMIVRYAGQEFETSYSISGNKLAIADAKDMGLPAQIDFEVSGDKLTLTSPDGEEETLTRK